MYQVVYTMMQMVMIYLIYIINNYMLEIEYSYVILGIKVCLIVFELMLSTYLFFRDINIIAEDRVDKNFKKEKKTENSAGTEAQAADGESTLVYGTKKKCKQRKKKKRK